MYLKDNHDKAEIDREKLDMEKRKAEADKDAAPTVYTFSLVEGTATIEEALG